MPVSCPDCAAQMPETAAFCPGCGASMQVVERAQGKVGFLSENVAGALAYFTFMPAILFLVCAPFSKNRFARFHSVQSILLWVAGIGIAAVVKLATLLLFIVPVAGPLLVLLISIIAALAAVLIWVVLVVKAFQGEMFKLPMLGQFAEQHTDAP